MKVYKFGGASVRSAEGVKNLRDIVGRQNGGLFVIVSAMGKTTNALETATERFLAGDGAGAKETVETSRRYHQEICSGLFGEGRMPAQAAALFDQLETLVAQPTPDIESYDYWYDRIVSFGELVSTSIIADYLATTGIRAKWLDIRRSFVTDTRHRDANIDLEASAPLLRAEVDGSAEVYIGQGFIGSDPAGETTTLGREGSDYSAAVAAYILDAESLTIWKDVEGVMNADPKIFPDAVYIPELTYLDAVELAYSGAQIIHPKTIKPLHNKSIPLYVRPFTAADKPGSVIRSETAKAIDVPVLILKHNQVLLSIRPRDFSFVLEDRLLDIFHMLSEYGIKPNLIQSSAVNLSVSVDESRHLPALAERLHEEGFRVVFNGDMQLLTVRGYTAPLVEKYTAGEKVYLVQKTRRTLRVVRKKE